MERDIEFSIEQQERLYTLLIDAQETYWILGCHAYRISSPSCTSRIHELACHIFPETILQRERQIYTANVDELAATLASSNPNFEIDMEFVVKKCREDFEKRMEKMIPEEEGENGKMLCRSTWNYASC